MNNIFVGNLSFHSTKEDVQKLFEPFGAVANVVIMERKKGKSRGYGFVDMPNEEEKNKAIAALNGFGFMGRVLEVSQVIPKVKGAIKPKRKPEPKNWDAPEKTWKPAYSQDREQRSARDDRRDSRSESRPQRKPYDRDAKPGYKKFSGPSKSGGYGSKSPYKKSVISYGEKNYSSPERKSYHRDEDSRSSSKPSYKKFEGAPKSSGYQKKSYSRDRDPRSSGEFKSEKPGYKKFEGSSKSSAYPKKDYGRPEYSTKTGHGAPGKKPAGKPKPGFKMFYKPGRPPNA
jgi:RNA recognition motif-containing protein